jgi:nucleotide-binding universal stress UspA family protein
MTAVEMISREIGETSVALPQVKVKSIVVATDGSDSALAAFKAANLIREHSAAEVRVLSVLEPLPIMLPQVDGMLVPPSVDDAREEVQRAIVTRQVRKFDNAATWTIDVEFGRPADVIAAYVKEHDAALVIIGTNKHGVLGRLLGEDTATDVARLSDVPLLVASPRMNRLPQRIIVAMDLNPDGMQRVGAVLRRISDKPSLSCVHVQPRSELLGVDWAQYDSSYQVALNDRYGDVENAFSSVNMRSDLIVLHGDVVHELVDFASYSKAELIVVGVKRQAGRARSIGGRVARRVIRDANCSVLVIPNVIPREFHKKELPGQTDVVRDPKLWSATLREFTSRNAGRIANLEVDDPEIGALVEASNYPLLGVDYDHRDNCLTISLGHTHGLARHLSRTITNPRTVSVFNVNGRDAALSIAHNGGQTLLTF